LTIAINETATLIRDRNKFINNLQYLRPLFSSHIASHDRFEQELARFIGDAVRVFPLGKARAGIYLLVKTALKRYKTHVIMSPYTIPDVLNMVTFAGGQPIFVDNLPRSTNVDVDHLSTLLDTSVACVLITHYHVNQNQISDIRNLCRSKGILLFDDCALAMGSQYQGIKIGSYTDASVFSMSSFKSLNYFLGGAITTASDELSDAISREINQWPELRKTQYAAAMIRTALYDFATKPSVFSKVTFPIVKIKNEHHTDAELLPSCKIDSQTLDGSLLTRPPKAAMWELGRKLPFVEADIERRQAIASIYDKILGDRFVSNDTNSHVRLGSSFAHYPIFVHRDYRDIVYRRVLGCNYHIGLSPYPNIHEMQVFKDVPGQSTNISTLVRSELTLPTHRRITEEYALRLAYSVRDAIWRERKRLLGNLLWP
jgi:dTDP-4-amino-4,6-dideoxygalactose transaminase